MGHCSRQQRQGRITFVSSFYTLKTKSSDNIFDQKGSKLEPSQTLGTTDVVNL